MSDNSELADAAFGHSNWKKDGPHPTRADGTANVNPKEHLQPIRTGGKTGIKKDSHPHIFFGLVPVSPELYEIFERINEFALELTLPVYSEGMMLAEFIDKPVSEANDAYTEWTCVGRAGVTMNELLYPNDY